MQRPEPSDYSGRGVAYTHARARESPTLIARACASFPWKPNHCHDQASYSTCIARGVSNMASITCGKLVTSCYSIEINLYTCMEQHHL